MRFLLWLALLLLLFIGEINWGAFFATKVRTDFLLLGILLSTYFEGLGYGLGFGFSVGVIEDLLTYSHVGFGVARYLVGGGLIKWSCKNVERDSEFIVLTKLIGIIILLKVPLFIILYLEQPEYIEWSKILYTHGCGILLDAIWGPFLYILCAKLRAYTMRDLL